VHRRAVPQPLPTIAANLRRRGRVVHRPSAGQGPCAAQPSRVGPAHWDRATQGYFCIPHLDRVSREWARPTRICTPYGACIVTRAGCWRTVMVLQTPDRRYRRVRITASSSSSANRPTADAGFTNWNPGGRKAPAIETGTRDAENCDCNYEQDAFEVGDRCYKRGGSEHELRKEVCGTRAWQTGDVRAE